jgi:hypothetical protein
MMCRCAGRSIIARLDFLAADRLPFVEISKMTTVTNLNPVERRHRARKTAKVTLR